MRWMQGEPERDPRLAAALRRAEAGLSATEADRLRAAIVRAAGPALAARRRRERPWWEWAAGWRRIAVPVGVAAGLAGGILAARSDPGQWLGESAAAATVSAASPGTLVLGAAAMAWGADSVTSELVVPMSQATLLGPPDDTGN